MIPYQSNPAAHVSMSQDAELVSCLTSALNRLNISHAVETGTHHGTGSTRMLIDAFRASHARHYFTITTMEADWASYTRAVANLAGQGRIEAQWGLSVGREEAIAFLRSDPVLSDHSGEPDIYIDGDGVDPRSFYLNELEGKLTDQDAATPRPPAMPDGLLRNALEKCAEPVLILLDSAGGVGYLEFQIVMDTMKKPFLLVLDDCNHIKHYRSLRRIKSDPRFKLLKEGGDGRWAVAEYR